MQRVAGMAAPFIFSLVVLRRVEVRAVLLIVVGALLGSCAGQESAMQVMQRLWPSHRSALTLVTNGRVEALALRDIKTTERSGTTDRVESECVYEVSQHARAPHLRVVEQSTLVRSNGRWSWVRTFTVEGLQSGGELFVRVPLPAPPTALEVRVHGARVDGPLGDREVRIPLARDESTEITLQETRR